MTSNAASLDGLPAYPEAPKDYERWTEWGKAALKRFDFGVLSASEDAGEDPRFALALRALVGAGVDKDAEPESAYAAAHDLLDRAHKLPAAVIRGAERLLRLSMERGATTPDVMFMAGAFAWPLQHVYPRTSADAWEYLVHAPWQTSSLALRDFCRAAIDSRAATGRRRLVDLATARLDAGLADAAQELLEGMVLLAIDRKDTCEIACRKDLEKLGPVPDLEQALVGLAKVYIESGNDQVHAREVIWKAGQVETAGSAYREVVEARVWDRPFSETYEWSEKRNKSALDAEVRRVLQAGQPHHARRLCEAVVTRELDKHVVGSFKANTDKALEKLARKDISEIMQAFALARATEHLAVLYSRTGYSTKPARALVRRVVQESELSGAATPLGAVRLELEAYLADTSPYGALRRQEERLEKARESMTDDEKAAAEASHSWLESSFTQASGAAEAAIQAVTAPAHDLADFVGRAVETISGVQDTSERALRFISSRAEWLAGDTAALRAEGAAIRQRTGAGLQLKEFARNASRLEPVGAAVGAGVLALLPPGFGLVTAGADIAVLLVTSYRVVARVGAVYGIDMKGPQGLGFAADAFTLGCSSKDGEGLLAYVSRGPRSVHRAVTLGSVAYGGAALARHLWTATNQPAAAVLQQAISSTARLVGISLAQKEVAKILPFAGAVVAGISAHTFVESIRGAAIEIAARDALLDRVPRA